jgi:predicted MFS family arabinose efflux permease
LETPTQNATSETASWRELWQSGLAGRLALLSFGVWLHAGDELLVATITPQIVAGIGGAHLIAWLTALYEVGSIISGAASALLVLRLGLRNGLLLAVLTYFIGCLLSGFAPSMPVMLVGRLVQGLGGGALVGMSLIAAWKLFPERLIARVIATISVVWGVAVFAGPLFGAFLATYFGWRGAFLAFALQAIIFALIIWRRMQKDLIIGSENDAEFPAGRILLLGFGIVAFAASGIMRDQLSAFGLLAAGFALVGLFLKLDSDAPSNRLLPMGAGNPASPAGTVLLMVFGLSAGTIAFMIYAPTFLAARLNLSPLEIGGILMLESIAWSLSALLVSGVKRRHEPLWVSAGFIWVALSIAGLSYAIPYGSIWMACLCSIGQGAGFGCAWTFVYRRAVELVSEADQEKMTAAISTVQRVGYAIGAAYVGLIANRSGFADVDLKVSGATIAQSLFLWCLVPALIGLASMFRFVILMQKRSANSVQGEGS